MYRNSSSSRCILNCFVSTVFVAAGFSLGGGVVDAATMVLTSDVAGVYTYQIQVSAGQQLFFNIGDRINFTGLSGVTGASVSGLDFLGNLTTCGVTATTVCFGAPNPFDLDNITNSNIDFGSLIIDSTATQLGNISYSLDNNPNSGLNGEVSGPVSGGATAPEPASEALSALALIVLPAFVKRRLTARKTAL